MILATTTVEDVDRFLEVFGTKGAEKRSAARLEGLDGVPRPHRGEPGLGAVRLGRGGLGRASCPTPRSRRSSRRPGTSASPRRRLLLGTLPRREEAHDDSTHRPARIRVGVITDQTGALSFMGIANANVAKMVIDDINAARRPARPPRRAVRRGQRDRRQRGGGRGGEARRAGDVDVVVGGIYSSTRQAIKGPVVDAGQDALHLPGAVRGAGVPPADLLHRPGAGAAGRAALPVADASRPGRRRSTCRRPTTSGRTR